MSDFNLNTLEGQVEHILRKEQEADASKGLQPMSPKALEVFRNNIYTSFKEGRAGQLTQKYKLPEIAVELNSNYSNSTTEKPDFAQELQPAQPLPPTTSFRELLEPYYGDKTDQELGAAMGYVDQNFAPTGTSGARQNIPQSFQSKLYSRFTPEQANAQLNVNPTYKEQQAVYDSGENAIYAGRGLQNLVQPAGNAMYNTGPTSRINPPAALPETGAIVPEMASAQRQHFKNTGSRMTPEQLSGYLDNGNFQQFQPPTQKALQHLQQQKQSQDPAQQQQYQDLLKILPSLVRNKLTPQYFNV